MTEIETSADRSQIGIGLNPLPEIKLDSNRMTYGVLGMVRDNSVPEIRKLADQALGSLAKYLNVSYVRVTEDPLNFGRVICRFIGKWCRSK